VLVAKLLVIRAPERHPTVPLAIVNEKIVDVVAKPPTRWLLLAAQFLWQEHEFAKEGHRLIDGHRKSREDIFAVAFIVRDTIRERLQS